MNQVTFAACATDIYIDGQSDSVGWIVPHDISVRANRTYDVVAYRDFREESYRVAENVSLERAQEIATDFFKREENILSLRDCLSA